MIFDLNFEKLITRLLPAFLRKKRQVKWLHVLLSPVQTLYGQFIDYRNDTLDEFRYNGQIIMLEHLLIKTFDKDKLDDFIGDPINKDLKRIFITDELGYTAGDKDYLYKEGDTNVEKFLYQKGEEEEENYNPAPEKTYLYMKEEYILDKPESFRVNYRSEITNKVDEDKLKALVRKYKLAGMQFSVNKIGDN